MPADPHYRSFQKELLPAVLEKEMGIIGMKVPPGPDPFVVDAAAGRLPAGLDPGPPPAPAR